MSRPYNLSINQEQECIALYEQGMSCAKISNLYPASPATIRTILIKNGIQRRYAYETIEQEDEFSRSYQNGLTAREVANLYGVSCVTVLRSLKRHNINPRSPGKKRFGYDNNLYRNGGCSDPSATAMFYRATKSGEIKRQTTCSVCGSNIKVEAHHHDYNKPYDVQWLCRKCHYHWHVYNVPIPRKEESE